MLLEIKDLNAHYGPSHVLQGINLNIAEGELVALLGRNGMGKSTTLKSIMGMVKPTSGAVFFGGRNIAGLPPYRVAKAGIGYVPEERRIFPDLSVLDNLMLGVKRGNSANQNNPAGWTVERIFHHFPKLAERTHQHGGLLSGGEQQMLSIGRALMGNPRLLLVDEPSEGLAPIMVQEVRNVLEQINKAGVSVLLVEHNLKVALSLAQRVYLMSKSCIGCEAGVEEVKNNHDLRAKYLEVQ
jgi:branched-chain amino acid transport system ATP-binding protein